jgi:ATP adenylyltransferase
MNLERLWAPWRLQYVTHSESATDPPPEPEKWLNGAEHDCFLCRGAAEFSPDSSADRKLLVMDRGKYTLVVLNRYPYNNGHLLIAPRRHVRELGEMSHDEHVECMNSLAQLTEIYRRCLNPDGFNVGLNLGRVAGAGLPGHLHWHLVPRWNGDTNFMPVLAGVRVIPQSLEELWQMLSDQLHKGNNALGRE